MTHALALGTRDAMLLYHAGMIERALGNADAARKVSRVGARDQSVLGPLSPSGSSRGARLTLPPLDRRLRSHHVRAGDASSIWASAISPTWRRWITSSFSWRSPRSIGAATGATASGWCRRSRSATRSRWPSRSTGAVRLPTALIEFLIPLTIVATALENLIVRNRERAPLKGRYRPVFAGVFGLVHGAGFANYLRSLFSGSIALPLFGFNVGIEIGQIVVLLLAGIALALLDRAAHARPVARGLPSAYRLRVVTVSLFVVVVGYSDGGGPEAVVTCAPAPRIRTHLGRRGAAAHRSTAPDAHGGHGDHPRGGRVHCGHPHPGVRRRLRHGCPGNARNGDDRFGDVELCARKSSRFKTDRAGLCRSDGSAPDRTATSFSSLSMRRHPTDSRERGCSPAFSPSGSTIRSISFAPPTTGAPTTLLFTPGDAPKVLP